MSTSFIIRRQNTGILVDNQKFFQIRAVDSAVFQFHSPLDKLCIIKFFFDSFSKLLKARLDSNFCRFSAVLYIVISFWNFSTRADFSLKRRNSPWGRCPILAIFARKFIGVRMAIYFVYNHLSFQIHKFECRIFISNRLLRRIIG